MNLDAIALRRAEEQVESFRWQPEKTDRQMPRRPLQSDINAKRIKCHCGECRTCRNREYMRAFRGGIKRNFRCVSCGERDTHDQITKWCALCRTHKPAQYRAHAASIFSHGGGI